MVVKISYLLVSILFVRQCNPDRSFTSKTQDVLLDILMEFKIGYVIIIKNNESTNIKNVKTFSTYFISLRVKNSEETEKFMIGNAAPNIKTALVCNENSCDAEAILHKLKQVSTIRYVKYFYLRD